MTANKPEVVAWGVPNSRLTERQPFMQLLHTQEGTQYPELLDPLIRLSDYEALQAECTLLRAQLDAMTEHKMAAHQLIGIPASVGICEPIEGFAARPQDIMPAVRDMALKIEALQAECERLRNDVVALVDALQGLLNIVSDSSGVAGYHLNGNIADWDEFEEVENAEIALSTYLKQGGGDK